MGSTGTGKSLVGMTFKYPNNQNHVVSLQFIRLISGDTSVHVGHGLQSVTSEIQVVRFVEPKSGRKIVIVDTPGLDDGREGVTDTDILKKITKFLPQQCVFLFFFPFRLVLMAIV